MAKTQLKQRRTRISRNEIEKARQQILDNQSQPQAKKCQRIANAEKDIMPWGKDSWHGGIYCDPYGIAWGIDKSLNTIKLGKTEDVLEATRNIDREDAEAVIKAVKDYQPIKEVQGYQPNVGKFPTCHSNIKDVTPGNGRGDISNRATFKTDPQFLRLFDELLNKQYGLPIIHNRLKEKGYDIPYRTLGRWVKRRQPCLI